MVSSYGYTQASQMLRQCRMMPRPRVRIMTHAHGGSWQALMMMILCVNRRLGAPILDAVQPYGFHPFQLNPCPGLLVP